MNNSHEYLQGMFISRIIAGFVILGTGITVLLKAVWMTTPILMFLKPKHVYISYYNFRNCFEILPIP